MSVLEPRVSYFFASYLWRLLLTCRNRRLCSPCPTSPRPSAGVWSQPTQLGNHRSFSGSREAWGFYPPTLKTGISWVSPSFLAPPRAMDLTVHARWGRGEHCSALPISEHVWCWLPGILHIIPCLCESPILSWEDTNTEPLCSGYYAFPVHMLPAHTCRLASPCSWVSCIPRFLMEFEFKCENSPPHNKSGISMPFSTSVFSCE